MKSERQAVARPILCATIIECLMLFRLFWRKYSRERRVRERESEGRVELLITVGGFIVYNMHEFVNATKRH